MTPTSEVVARAGYRVGNPSAWAEGYDETISEEIRAMLALISSLVAENGKLRDVLEPFAKIADEIERDYGLDTPDSQMQFPALQMRLFRKARASIGGVNG